MKIDSYRPGDSEPPVGSVLECGSERDKITFMRATTTWMIAYNAQDFRPCDRGLLDYWASDRHPLRITRVISSATPDRCWR